MASIEDYNECVVTVVYRAEWDVCVCILSAYIRRRAGSSLRSLPALFAHSLLLPDCFPVCCNSSVQRRVGRVYAYCWLTLDVELASLAPCFYPIAL